MNVTQTRKLQNGCQLIRIGTDKLMWICHMPYKLSSSIKILLPLMNCIVRKEVTKKIIALSHSKKILENHFGLQTKKEKSPWGIAHVVKNLLTLIEETS